MSDRPGVVNGLIPPLLVGAAAALAGFVFGALWAACLLAVGAGAIIGFHLWHLHLLSRWAAGPLDAPVPEGGGVWRAVFSALYRRVRVRSAHQRDLASTIERFSRAAEAVPDGMVVLDAGNHIRWANARALTYLGLDRVQDAGKPLTHLVRQPEVVRYVDAGDYGEAIVFPSQRAPGITLALQVVPFGTEEKLLICRDVTQIESVARMRRDFIANVSHELKTPLTVVVGFLEMLQDMELSADQRDRYVALMQAQARSMERLVGDLLTLSALESEHNVTEQTSFPILSLIEDVCSQARALSGGSHEIEIEAGPVALVTGSRDELASAFGNLVSNAIRYTPPAGRVLLGWDTRADGAGVFRVVDTGIGIGPEHIPRLTERFYRVDRSRSRATGGTGLGLAIVKHVLMRHQAVLEIASVPGQGSTFAVVIPATRVTWQKPGEHLEAG